MAAEDETAIDTVLVDGHVLPLAPVPTELKTRRAYLRAEDVTVAHLERFFVALEEIGTFYKAANMAGLSYQTVNRLKKQDEEFREMVDEAMTVFRESIEHEAHRRAVKGWDEPVFSQKTGEQMGVVRKYDGKLLELLLKRHIPEFREKFEGEIKISGGVLIAPVAPVSAEDWALQHGQTTIKMLTDKQDDEPVFEQAE